MSHDWCQLHWKWCNCGQYENEHTCHRIYSLPVVFLIKHIWRISKQQSFHSFQCYELYLLRIGITYMPQDIYRYSYFSMHQTSWNYSCRYSFHCYAQWTYFKLSYKLFLWHDIKYQLRLCVIFDCLKFSISLQNSCAIVFSVCSCKTQIKYCFKRSLKFKCIFLNAISIYSFCYFLVVLVSGNILLHGAMP